MKAVFLLGAEHLESIYGQEQRAEIEQMLEMVHPALDAASFQTAPKDALREVELIVSGWGMIRLDAAALDRMPSLRLVLYGAGSVRGFVTDAMWDRGVRVVSAWAANAVPVAEFALAQILFSLKRGWQNAAQMKASRGRSGRLPAPGAYKTTVGLLSLGMIGRLVRKKLRGMDVRVAAYDPFVSEADARKLGVDLLSLEEVFRQSDVVSCHTPWLPATEKMVRAEHFRGMKTGATFINTARGAVVDEAGMIEALRERPDLFAALDVTHPEPPDPASPLYDLPNVLVTPHIAGSMGAECRRMGRYMIEELHRCLAGAPLRYEVTREAAERMA